MGFRSSWFLLIYLIACRMALANRAAHRCACVGVSPLSAARMFSSTSGVQVDSNKNGGWRQRINASQTGPRIGSTRLESQSNPPSAAPGQSGTSYQQLALDSLTSSIEKLASSSATSTSPFSPSSSSVSAYSPNRANSASQRSTVSGRAFLNGHYYNPQTLSQQQIIQRPRRPARPILGPEKKDAVQQDLLYIHGLNPGKPSLHDDSYKNAPIISAFMSEMGKILPRAQTGLTRKSQRSIGKAIRRARAIGLLPVLSRGGARTGGAGWR